MKIYGLIKTTLLDYPGKVASTIFLGGCNLRCPFCHNMNLVTGSDKIDPIPIEDVMTHLKTRAGVIDGVCITGGEPTLEPGLVRLIQSIKNLGLLVKLDSNGTKFPVLEDLLSKKLLDYIAIDIKSSFTNYSNVCFSHSETVSEKYIDDIINNVSKTVNMLIGQNQVPYEFRTTVIKEYHDLNVFEQIGEMLENADSYYLQNFRYSESVPDRHLHGYTKGELQTFADMLSSKIKYVGIRGVD